MTKQKKKGARQATPADLVRAELRKGTPDEAIRGMLRRRFPRYGAWKVAVSFYRRELKSKGERLPVLKARRAIKGAVKMAAGEAGPAAEPQGAA